VQEDKNTIFIKLDVLSSWCGHFHGLPQH